MGQVQANEAVMAFLGPLKERTEVLDAKGTSPGYFIPNESPEA